MVRCTERTRLLPPAQKPILKESERNEADESGETDPDPPAPEVTLDTDDIGQIRSVLRDVEEPTTLEAYRDYERSNQGRQPVLDAIDLRLAKVS